MTTVIHAESLGKRYRLNAQISAGLRHTLEDFLRSPLQSLRRGKRETFWALKDVSLDVRDGEVLGLIGRNGAGKTTLLKILSRITQPTTGFAEIHGRVGSLLEVGTGFHPELTGRENAFLSGAILGMSKSYVTRRFDEIVAFAELEKFIDTPVKHYSSGMYVRLAFAIAAHLEPEILLVDEVLAVGDINFQKKCLGKMGDVAREGRTVVLVSHQINQIRRLCHRAVWVDDGQIRLNGDTHEVTSAYESAMARGERVHNQRHGTTSSKGRFLDWQIIEPANDQPHKLSTFGQVSVRFRLEVNEPLRNVTHGIALYNHERQLVWGRANYNFELSAGIHEFVYVFPMLPLRPGPYAWLVSLYDDQEEIDAWDCAPEMVIATPNRQHRVDHWNGVLNIPSEILLSSPDHTIRRFSADYLEGETSHAAVLPGLEK
jgi:lipopolysaccharide transport system ATP-binding protein